MPIIIYKNGDRTKEDSYVKESLHECAFGCVCVCE